MATSGNDSGKLLNVYGIAPAYLQRAVFVAVLAFLFFIAMMFAFYIRQSVGYFLLASAFLVLYLLTLFSWFMQRKTMVKVYENGVNYKTRFARWSEIESVQDRILNIRDEKPITIPRTIDDQGALFDLIRKKVG